MDETAAPDGPRREQRFVFGEVAETYDRVRPTYPGELYDALEAVTGLEAGARVVEVGAGTGKATAQLVRRYEVTAIEPDTAMAALLAVNVPDARVVAGVFETVELDPPYDAVLAAQSWHWVDGERGFDRAADLLTPAGWLALWWNDPHLDDTRLHDALVAVYRRHAPHLAAGLRVWHAHDRTADWEEAIARADRFGAPVTRHVPWSRTYDVDAYTALLRTQSDHRMLPPDTREALLAAVADLIADRGGEVTIAYRCYLIAAARAT